MRVGVLASGNGTNLQALLRAAEAGAAYTIVAVISNVAEAYALERARRAGVAAYWVDHRGRSRENFEEEVAHILRSADVELVCLAGFLRVLSPWFVRQFPGRILNIHPALLPDFGGRGMFGLRVHAAVLAAGRAQSGCTIHVVDESVDGGPILARTTVPVLPGDTPETLAARVAVEEHRLYPRVVRAVAEGAIRLGLPEVVRT